jgi:flagellar biosynthesis/type III secretory pathway protein FliH
MTDLRRPTDGPRLTQVKVSTGSRVIGDPQLALPTPQAIEEANAAAYQRGHQDGRAAGLREASSQAEQLHRSLIDSTTQLARTQRDQRQQLLAGLIDLATDIAGVIIGRTPHDGGAAVADRLQTLMHESAKPPLRVEVSESDHASMEQVLTPHDTAVAMAPDLSAGDIRVIGEWSHSAATLDSVATTVREALTTALSEEVPTQ